VKNSRNRTNLLCIKRNVTIRYTNPLDRYNSLQVVLLIGGLVVFYPGFWYLQSLYTRVILLLSYILKEGNMTDFIPETREEIDKAGMSVYEFSADNVKILAIEIEDMDDMDDDSSEQCKI